MSVSPIDRSSKNLYGLYTVKQHASAKMRPTLADKARPDYSMQGLTDVGFLSQSLEGKNMQSFLKRDS